MHENDENKWKAEGGGGAITIHLARRRHQHQQSNGKAPKRRLRFLPTPQCRVRLQRGRQQQPAHKNEGRGALDAAAVMRSNGPENQPAFAAARVKHTAQASSASSRSRAVYSTARAPLQSHLHFLHATPRHTLHYRPFPAIRRPVEHEHTGRRWDQSTARKGHAAEHYAHWDTRGKLGEHVTEGRQQFLRVPMPLDVWRLLREEPRRGFHELERALDLRAKLRWR